MEIFENKSYLNDLIVLLKEKREELEKYIVTNEASQPAAQDNWSDLNDPEWIEEDECDKTTKRVLLSECAIISVLTLVFGSATLLCVLILILTSIINFLINIRIRDSRLEKRYDDIDNAKAILDNLKQDNMQAREIIKSIDYVIELLNSVENEDNNTMLFENYNRAKNIYNNIIDVDFDTFYVKPTKKYEGFKVINSRKKYSNSKEKSKKLSIYIFEK